MAQAKGAGRVGESFTGWVLRVAAEATPVEAQPGRAAQDPPGETLAHTSCSLCLGQCLAAMCMMLCCGCEC